MSVLVKFMVEGNWFLFLFLFVFFFTTPRKYTQQEERYYLVKKKRVAHFKYNINLLSWWKCFSWALTHDSHPLERLCLFVQPPHPPSWNRMPVFFFSERVAIWNWRILVVLGRTERLASGLPAENQCIFKENWVFSSSFCRMDIMSLFRVTRHNGKH